MASLYTYTHTQLLLLLLLLCAMLPSSLSRLLEHPRSAACVCGAQCVGRWRTASRKFRHARIDSFWERSVVELREALQGHYEPKIAGLQAQVRDARSER